MFALEPLCSGRPLSSFWPPHAFRALRPFFAFRPDLPAHAFRSLRAFVAVRTLRAVRPLLSFWPSDALRALFAGSPPRPFGSGFAGHTLQAACAFRAGGARGARSAGFASDAQ